MLAFFAAFIPCRFQGGFMTISLVCSSCQAKLNIPDNLAGKRAKCPKCQQVLTIPAAGAEVAAPAQAPRKATAAPNPAPTAAPASAAPPAVAQAPRVVPDTSKVSSSTAPYSSAQPASRLNPVLLAVVGGGGLLLLVGIVTIVIWLASGDRKPVVAQSTPKQPAGNPANAKPAQLREAVAASNSPDTANSAPTAVPGNPTTEGSSSQGQGLLAGQWSEFADEKMGLRLSFPAPPADDDPKPETPDDSISAQFQRDMLKSMKEKGQLRMMRATKGPRSYLASAMALPLSGMSAAQYFDRIEANIGALHPGFEIVGQSARGEVDGHSYCELKLKNGTIQKVVRMIPANDVVYGLMVEGAGVAPADGDVRRFFASLKLSKPQLPSRPAPQVATKTPANATAPDSERTPSANDPATTPKAQAEPTVSPLQPAVPLGPPFEGKKSQFTICFPEGATVKTIDTFKAFTDAKRRNETKNRWNDDKAFYESFTAEREGRTYLITAWRDRELKGNDANNAQLRRIRDLLSDQLKGGARPSIVNSDLAKKVDGRSIYTRRYRRDGLLFVYQEVREGAFSCVLQVECPSEVDERTDPLIWAFFNSLQVTP
jgi:hypothetical protein